MGNENEGQTLGFADSPQPTTPAPKNESLAESVLGVLRRAFWRSAADEAAAMDARREDAKGNLILEKHIRPMDLARDDMVKLVAERWLGAQAMLRDFKLEVSGAIEAFIATSAAEFEIDIGGKEGNVTLTSYSGEWKLVRRCHKLMQFNERLLVARRLIDEYLDDITSGVREEVRMIIQDAFMSDEAGHVSPARVLSLRRYNFDDMRWKKAMEAVAESIVVSGSIYYLNLYRRGDDGKYQLVPLDMAAI